MDVAWELANIYSKLLGQDTYNFKTDYPLGHLSFGAVTQNGGIESTEINKVFNNILEEWNVSNSKKERLSDDILTTPFFSKGVSKQEKIGRFGYIPTFQSNLKFSVIDERSIHPKFLK